MHAEEQIAAKAKTVRSTTDQGHRRGKYWSGEKYCAVAGRCRWKAFVPAGGHISKQTLTQIACDVHAAALLALLAANHG